MRRNREVRVSKCFANLVDKQPLRMVGNQSAAHLVLLSLFFFVHTSSLSAQNWGAPVWSDEFNGAANSAPDSAKWVYDVGNLNVNHELEIYCANPIGASPAPPCDATNPNAYQDGNGNLVIKAIKTASGTWTSARLKTKGIPTANFQYGRMEARMKLPSATGLWPAFWMLGSNISTVGWPQSGEIDIMENVLTAPLGPTKIASTIHGPGYSGGNGISHVYAFPNSGRVDDSGYHIYGVIWSPYLIQFYVDDPTNVFTTVPASAIPSETQWVYNHDFFLIMNLAVGGDWPGPPDSTTPNPSLMYVDYVRVYKAAAAPGPDIAASPITVTAGQTGTSTLNLTATKGMGKVYLICSNAPANSTCAITPTYVDFSASATATATLSLSTQPRANASFFDRKRSLVLLSLSAAIFGLLLAPVSPRIRKTTHVTVAVALLGLFGTGMNACGGGGSTSTPTPPTLGGTPSGSYSVTVTSYTVSADQSTVSVPVTVN
jgi:beta-glucanase (GH16 family)